MTDLIEAPSSTSASGAMLRQVGGLLLVSPMLAGFGTSAAWALPAEVVARSTPPAQQTTAGTSTAPVEHARTAIAELRRVSGLTWDQLARLFNVSPRSLHFWASGKVMTPANEEHLQRLLAVIHKTDRGTASANRAALLAAREDGTIPFDLLAAGEYDRAVALVGPGQAKPRLVVPKLSDAEMAARAPRPPGELVDALQDRVHREAGIARPAKSVKVRRGP